MSATYIINTELDGIEIIFDEKPSEEVRAELKESGFRWHKIKKIWYARQNPERLELAEKLANINESESATEPKPFMIPPDEFVDGGGLYDGWCGGNRDKWHSQKELKALLLADFKKAGISATIRFGRGGYTTSMYVTIKITSNDIIPFDGWLDNIGEWFNLSLTYSYKIDDCYDVIDGCDLYNLVGTKDVTAMSVLHGIYDCEVERVTSGHTFYGDVDIFTDSAKKKYDMVRAIVHSYNRDCSNSQIDYFDRSIYDNYAFKLVR